MVTDILTDRAPKTTLDCAPDRSSLRVATSRRQNGSPKLGNLTAQGVKVRAIQTGKFTASSGFGPPSKPFPSATLTTPIAPPAAIIGDPDIPPRMASVASVIHSPRPRLEMLQENHLPFNDMSHAVLLAAGRAGENLRRC